MLKNVYFCLKGECFSKLLAIFVVLITLTKQTNQHQEKRSFGTTALQGTIPMGLCPGSPQTTALALAGHPLS